MMELEIVFAFRSIYGQGTTLTHAAELGADKTLCGKHITRDWLYDTNWVVDHATLSVHGPECKGCIASAFSLLAAQTTSPAQVPDGGR